MSPSSFAWMQSKEVAQLFGCENPGVIGDEQVSQSGQSAQSEGAGEESYEKAFRQAAESPSLCLLLNTPHFLAPELREINP